jgi:alkylation response protein AidB-like acyl-CoA dehydrogenase
VSHRSVDEKRALDLPATLRGAIEDAADEAEKLGRLPDQLVEELRASGALGLFTPREYGGLEVSLSTALTVYEELARIDASVAWVVWNANFGFSAAMLSEAGAAQVWPGGAQPVLTNGGQPGQAVAVGRGYRLSGRWRMVSGIDSADWFLPMGIVDGGARLFHLRRDQLTIEQTWNVSGMRGTGSQAVVLDEVFVAGDLTADIGAPLRIDRPTYRTGPMLLVFAGCTSVSLGIVREALDVLVELAKVKTTPFGVRLAEDARLQEEVGRIDGALGAARLLLRDAARRIDETVEAGDPVPLELNADLHTAMAHAATVSRRALTTIYELGSSSSIFVGERLERLHRDGMIALQHVNQSAKFFGGSGRVRLGLEPGLPIF